MNSWQGAFPPPPVTEPAGPIRCVLIEIPNRRTRWRNIFRLEFSGPRRPLAIDVGKDAVWVIDLNTNALIASALLTQVKATPAAHIGRSSEFAVWTMPVLIVSVPGLQPLTIGPTPASLSSAKHRYRASWRKGVSTTKHPTYLVKDADWLTLAEKFGLGPDLRVAR